MTNYKLVPVEPTPEMLVAINWPNDPAGYRAMLAAAPQPAPPTPDVAGVVSEADCRRLLAGFAMDYNAVGADYAAKNLFKGMKLLARTAAHQKRETSHDVCQDSDERNRSV